MVALSYNIHHGAGMDGRIDLEWIAAVINAVSPDIVALQEVDVRTDRCGGVDQAKELARLTGTRAVFGRALRFQGGEYGNAVLTNLPVTRWRAHALPGEEPRAVLTVICELSMSCGSPIAFAFLATHLDLVEKERLASVPAIAEAVHQVDDLPAILAGDFNDTPGSPTLQALGETWIDATAGQGLATYPAKAPAAQIDFILVRPALAWRVVEARAIDEAMASDHRPVLAVLECR